MKPVGTKTIRTERLYLRAPKHSDAEELVQVKSLAMPLEEARKTVAAMVEESTRPFVFHWVITLNGKAIGRVKGWEVSPYNGHLQLGYDIAPAHRGCGYMTEAVHAIIRYLFDEAEANRVYCSVRVSNAASRRVCEKCGLQHEGTMRQHYARQDGGYDDVMIFGILREEAGTGAAEYGA